MVTRRSVDVLRDGGQLMYGSIAVKSLGHMLRITVMYSFIEAWALMLLLGMFAGYLAIPGLAIGYWASLGISCLWATARGSCWYRK